MPITALGHVSLEGKIIRVIFLVNYFIHYLIVFTTKVVVDTRQALNFPISSVTQALNKSSLARLRKERSNIREET